MKSLKYRTANGICVYTNKTRIAKGLIGLTGSKAMPWNRYSIVPNEAEPLNLRYQAPAW